MNRWIADSMTWMLAGGDKSFAAFYAAALRPNLFAGFLTLCAFLFSVKTFLLVTLQKDVYGTPVYGERIRRLQDVRPSLNRYSQLRWLNGTIFWAVSLTFVAAAMQLTIGLIDANWAAATCVAVSLVAGADVGYNLHVQRRVISDWLDFLDESPPDHPSAT